MAEKRYYWIKLKDTFLTSDAVDFLMSQKNGANYVVLYQMLCLKTINTGGELSRQIGEVIIPFDIDKIHRDCKYFEKDTVVVALELYRKLGLVYENKNGFLQIADFGNLVGGETKWAEYKRLERQKEEQKRIGQSPKESPTEVQQDIDIKISRYKDNRKYKESISKDIPKKESKSTFDDLISSYTSNSELHNSIIEFIKMRKLIKKPMTDKALSLTLNDLDRLSKNDSEKIAILEKSIKRCWQGVFPLNEDKPAESTDINKAIDIINNRRNQAELLQSRFLADLRKNPSFAEAESRLDGLRFDKSKAECQGKDTTALKEQLKAAEEDFAEALRIIGYSLDDLITKYFCQKCKDTGFINGQQCECLKKIMEV